VTGRRGDRGGGRVARARGEAGLTLVELVVAIALLGTLTAMLGPVLVGSFRASDAATSDGIAADDLRVATAMLEHDLRGAACVALPLPGGTGGALQLTTRAGGATVAVRWEVVGGRVVRSVAGSAGAPVGTLDGSVSFARSSTGLGAVTATVTATRPAGRAARTATVTVAPRVLGGSC
jgi:type II secretory pathway pseudopilin PulG